MIQASALAEVPSLPHHASVLRQLQARGVALHVLPEEAPELGRARLETALMALFRDERDPQVFQVLYDYASPDLEAWVGVMLAGSRAGRRFAEPAELVQDTLVNVYRYADGFRDEHPRSFRVWAHTIATNLLRRSCLRRHGHGLQPLPEGHREPSDRRAGPTEELVLGEDQRSLLAAWMIVLMQYAVAYEQLPARDRLALAMIEVEGLSYAAASRRLNVGLSNMKMILFRARRRIRARIGACLEEQRRTPIALAG